MSDILTVYNNDTGAGDFIFGAQAAEDAQWAEIHSAALISLFTDAQAAPNEVLPIGETDRRGWHGETGTVRRGSKWWLRVGLPRTAATLDILRLDAQAALKWLIDDGVVTSIDITMSFVGAVNWGAAIVFTRGRASRRFDFAWKGGS